MVCRSNKNSIVIFIFGALKWLSCQILANSMVTLFLRPFYTRWKLCVTVQSKFNQSCKITNSPKKRTKTKTAIWHIVVYYWLAKFPGKKWRIDQAPRARRMWTSVRRTPVKMAAIASTSWETSSAPALSTSLAVSARRGEQLVGFLQYL